MKSLTAWDRIQLRLNHGGEHIQRLREACDNYFAGEPPPIEIVPSRDSNGDYVYRASVRSDVPYAVSLIAGDCIHNLRAILDNVIWQMWPTRSAAFPVCIDATKYNQASIRGIPANAQTIVEQLQPYHGTTPNAHHLYILHSLWINDKHHSPNVILACAPIKHVMHNPIAGRVAAVVSKGPIKDAQEIARVTAVPNSAESEMRMRIEFVPEMKLAFEWNEAGSLLVIPDALDEMHRYLKDDVLPRFTRFL